MERETSLVSGNRVVVTPWGQRLSNNYPLLLTRSDLERETRFELATPTLARLCSTTELFPHNDVVLCTYFMVTAQFLSYYKIHPVFCLLGQPSAVLNCSRQFSPAYGKLIFSFAAVNETRNRQPRCRDPLGSHTE